MAMLVQSLGDQQLPVDSVVPDVNESSVEETSGNDRTESEPTEDLNDSEDEGEKGRSSDAPEGSEAAAVGESDVSEHIDLAGDQEKRDSESTESETREEGGISSANQQVSLLDIHRKKDAELEEYLDSLKPKPKRKSIKEMLMSMPGYKDLASMKPKIGGGDGKKEDVIILDVESNNRRKAKDVKRQRQIEELKDRFVRHCITAPPKSGKGEHVKLKINKKEEDSQGIEHLVENEVEYVRNPLNEEEEAVGFLTPQLLSSSSPKSAAPGASRRKLQQTLMEKIRAQKLKEHEERVKEYKMYTDENDGDEKEEEEEIIEDDDNSDNDSDVIGEEEEELEDLLDCSSKKKKKSAFVDDEAEDEDDDGADADDDTESESEESEGSEESEEEDVKSEGIAQDLEKDAADVGNSSGTLEDSVTPGQVPPETTTDVSTPSKNMVDDDSCKSSDCGVDFTPKVTSAVLNQRTPADFWIPAKSNHSSRQIDELSPLIPKINKPTLKEEQEEMKLSAPEIPESLVNVISEAKPGLEDLVNLCSGRFVSQVNTEAIESQEDEFGGFDFGDDEDACLQNDDKGSLKTPKADTSITAVDGVTPKLCEKIPKTRLLMQFDEEAQKTIVDQTKKEGSIDFTTEGDEEEIIGIRIKGRKQKRLQFSDDEDDGPEEMPSNSHSGEESAEDLELEEEAEEMSQEIVVEKPKSSGFFNKYGKLKRKFVEDEAELSGSEDGSGDEDEKGLNHYEEEEGDDEEIDENDLKNQVERVHLKQLLDDDDRELLKLQDQFLQNGDLHSDRQRERKFTWNINMHDLNDDANFGDSDDDQDEENPEENTEKQAWIEKRKWLSENSHLLEAGEDESQSLLSNSRFLKMSKNAIKKLEAFVDTSASESSNIIISETTIQQRRSIYEEIIKSKSEAKKQKPNADSTSCSEGLLALGNDVSLDRTSKSVSQPLFGETTWSKPQNTSSLKKGSFLSRGGMMLARLADMSKPGDAVSNVKNNSRNFVFQHITPPNQEKSDGSTSRVKRAGTKAGNQNATKKLKIDRSFHNLDEASKGASIFKWL